MLVNQYTIQRQLDGGGIPHAGDAIEALLDAGADAMTRNAAGRTPWDLAQENELLRNSDGYWRLNDARFDVPREGSRRPAATQPGRRQSAMSQRPARRGPACEIPGLPVDDAVAGAERPELVKPAVQNPEGLIVVAGR